MAPLEAAFGPVTRRTARCRARRPFCAAAQEKVEEAAAALAQFEGAWAAADVTLESSRY